MININMQNVNSIVIGDLNRKVLNQIDQKISYEIGGFGEKKETKYLFKNNMIQTGLVPYLISVLKTNGIPYKLNDFRIKPPKNADFKMNPNFQPRDYQDNIITRASSREVIQAATGAGKTFIMASLIAKFNVKPIVVVAPKVSLAIQIKEEFEKFLEVPVGIIGGGYNQIEDITVGTPQSLKKKLLEKAVMIMGDEIHNCPCSTIQAVFNMAINAYYRIGVSATPWRDSGDDILIEAVLNVRRPQLSINASTLIKKGKLVPCTINMVKFDNSNIPWQGSYNKTYEKAISHNADRNAMILNLTKKEVLSGKSVIILISKITHGDLLLNGLKRVLGYEEKEVVYNGETYTVGNIEFTSGRDDINRRQAVFIAAREGFVKVLIGSTIADEGLDISCLQTLILCGSGKCSTRAFQRVGRVLRLHPSKTYATVYDFMDMNSTFYKHSIIREALYKTEPEWKIREVNDI